MHRALLAAAIGSVVGLGSGCATTSSLFLISANEPVIERDKDDLIVRWDGVSDVSPVSIYAGRAPDAIDRSRSVAVMLDEAVTLRGLDPSARWFFELTREGEPPILVSERLIPLEGTNNFRDLGGYKTSDGRRVRWGMMYRSDDLADLTGSDLKRLRRLDIRLVCDFRSDAERERGPSRLPESGGPKVANLSIQDERFDPDKIGDYILGRDLEGVNFAKILIEGNRAFATKFSPQYAAMFKRLSDPSNLPALVHCTQGKDRTGFAAAILLTALGVPRETIMEDYLLTNVYTANEAERMILLIRAYLFFQTPDEAIRPLFQVRTDYLEAAFEAIEEEYGSVDEYLRIGLGMSDAEREQLRDTLLTEAPPAAASTASTPSPPPR